MMDKIVSLITSIGFVENTKLQYFHDYIYKNYNLIYYIDNKDMLFIELSKKASSVEYDNIYLYRKSYGIIYSEKINELVDILKLEFVEELRKIKIEKLKQKNYI
jgi:hypothetical protein